MPPTRLRLGQLLVDARIITAEQLDEVLKRQKADGRRLGTLLTEAGLVNETQLTQILSQQLNAPWVSLYHIDFSRQLLNLVPRQVVERYCLVPIYVRHVRNQGETLYVAMDDPSNEEALKACAESSGLPVRAMIAPPSDIRNAIRVYYGGRASQPSIPSIEAAPITAVPTGSEPVIVSAAPVEIPQTQLSPEPETPPFFPAVQVPPSVPSSGARLPTTAAQRAALSATLKTDTGMVNSPVVVPPATASGSVGGSTGGERISAPPVPPPRASAPAIVPASERTSAPPPSRPSAPSTPPAPSSARPPAPAAEVPAAAAGVPAPPPARPEEKSVPIFVDEVHDVPVREQPPKPGRRSPAEAQPAKRAPRMVALTLLDGTTITLPAAKKKRRARPLLESSPELGEADMIDSEDELLTARDLVAALRAVSHGADATEILGANARWEAMFAALLSLLLRKHLIADWEFIEEFKKI